MASASALPLGLENLGNTCYLNSTLQCFRQVPELKTALMSMSGAAGRDSITPGYVVARGLSNLFQNLDVVKDGDKIYHATDSFIRALRQTYPQYGQMAHGHFIQQDANECWVQLMQALAQVLPSSVQETLGDRRRSEIDDLFGFQQEICLTCDEDPQEAPIISVETALQLTINIDRETGFLMSGLKKVFEGQIERRSLTLQRDARYSKKVLLTRLPGYATINFVRFFYKRAEKTSCKIRKDVKFGLTMDLIDLCAPKLKEKLKVERDAYKADIDLTAELEAAGKKAKTDAKGDSTLPIYRANSFLDDPGSNNSGYYELIAVLTHKGSTADSGHYVAWTKYKKGQWLMCDDNEVTLKTDADILKLSGEGADWHTAYTLLYSSVRIPAHDPVVGSAGVSMDVS